VSHLRILCLHGYHGSATTLRDRMAPLVAALPTEIEFDYVSAPSLATGGFGFSQGAALAGLLTAVQESGTAPPEFHFDFSIMVGGFTSNLPKHADLFRHTLTTPSVHVIGRRDAVVPGKDSLRLADRVPRIRHLRLTVAEPI
jgi:predicted esterase